MERAVYCVSLWDDQWFIRLNGKRFGPCPSRDHALLVAKAAAQKAHAQGHPAHVLVQERSAYRTVWLNGREALVSAA